MSARRFAFALLIGGVMVAGAAGFLLSHTSAQQTRTIHLAQGWNLVTWTGDKQSASQALTGVSDAVSVVYGYNNDSQVFTLYSQQIATLTDFEPEEAYWLLATQSADWSVPGPDAPLCPTTTPCPTGTPCPVPTPCPACPSAADLSSEICAGLKVSIETYEVLLDIAEEGLLVGATESEVRATLGQFEQGFEQACQGIPLAEPSLLTSGCAMAAKWKGLEEGHMLYAPDPQTQIWINQFDDIVDEYCMP